MFRFLLTLTGVLVLAMSGFSEDPKPGSVFGKEIRIPANTGFSTNVSPDGLAATVVFDNLLVAANPAQKGQTSTQNQTALQTKVVTIHIPYTTDQKSVTMTMDIRGYLGTDSAGVAKLVVCAGGATKVVDLSTTKTKEVKLKGKSKGEITPEHPGAQFGDFQDRIEFTVQARAAKPVSQITLFLLAEHDTDTAGSGGAMLAVDSIDVSITKSAKAKLKP